MLENGTIPKETVRACACLAMLEKVSWIRRKIASCVPGTRRPVPAGQRDPPGEAEGLRLEVLCFKQARVLQRRGAELLQECLHFHLCPLCAALNILDGRAPSPDSHVASMPWPQRRWR